MLLNRSNNRPGEGILGFLKYVRDHPVDVDDVELKGLQDIFMAELRARENRRPSIPPPPRNGDRAAVRDAPVEGPARHGGEACEPGDLAPRAPLGGGPRARGPPPATGSPRPASDTRPRHLPPQASPAPSRPLGVFSISSKSSLLARTT